LAALSVVEKGVLVIEIVLAGAILTGLAARRGHRSSISFDVYLLSIVVFEFLLLFWPGRFYNWDYWFAQETIQSLLKVSIVIELSIRVFAGLPRARVTVAIGLGLIAAGTLLSIADVDATGIQALAVTIMPRIFYGTAIMFGLILTLALSYRVALEDVHKAILMGFTPYLLTFTVGIQLLEAAGRDLRIPVQYVNTLAFFGLLGYWLRAAWRQATPAQDLSVGPEGRLPAAGG
jgi:hypothetical protein